VAWNWLKEYIKGAKGLPTSATVSSVNGSTDAGGIITAYI